MSNLVKWILEKTNESNIEAVVIGEMGWGDYGDDPKHNNVSKEHQRKKLTWRDAKILLNYNFDSGYGSPECNAIYVWTKTHVLFIVQYDGSTSMHSVPRNPIDCMPRMPGG